MKIRSSVFGLFHEYGYTDRRTDEANLLKCSVRFRTREKKSGFDVL
jgi:hypothetical protein